MFRAAAFATLLSAAIAPPASAADGEVREHRVGSCKVSTPGPLGSAQEDVRRSVVVSSGSRRLVVAPVDGVEQWLAKRNTSVDAVLLTSLDDGQVNAVLDGERIRFAGARIFVDRDVLDRARDRGWSTAALRSLLGSGRLYAVDANVDVLPGVRFSIPPATSIAATRVVVRCGDTTLVAIGGGELDQSGLGKIRAASPDSRDPARLRRLVGDAFLLAPTTGYYPGILSIYRHHDGFRIGSIEAREYGGAAPRTGRVIVETAAAGPR